MIFTCSLQSGSNGNCFYVETPDARLLFDAGLSGKTAQERLAHHHRDIHDVDALIISHNHGDHTCGAGVFHRKFHLPLYITAGSFQACSAQIGPIDCPHTFQPGQSLRFHATTVHTIPTPHDGRQGVAFVIEHDNKRLGIFTDMGHPFPNLGKCIAGLDALYLESNYDPDMLAQGDYPVWLKRRIAGHKGHLSNQQAATLILDHAPALQFLTLAHLSHHNNTAELALATARDTIGPSTPIALSPRSGPSQPFHID